MKSVALLRGINVGGNNIIKMADPKGVFERSGYRDVATFIQSGNVVFETDELNVDRITADLEECVSLAFSLASRLIVLSRVQLERVLDEVPKEWNERTDIRCNLGFIKAPATAEDALRAVTLREGVDSAKVGDGVLSMTTVTAGRGLSTGGFTKLVGTEVYRAMTMRNYNTTQKLLARLEQWPFPADAARGDRTSLKEVEDDPGPLVGAFEVSRVSRSLDLVKLAPRDQRVRLADERR